MLGNGRGMNGPKIEVAVTQVWSVGRWGTEGIMGNKRDESMATVAFNR